MSMLTALSLSFNNLLTKKARTFLTSFAGSIGIIGIALILSLSSGVNSYINNVQKDTLTSYPLTINSTATDMTGAMASIMNDSSEQERTGDKLYVKKQMTDMVGAMASEINENDI